ncbi:hypothetical protein K4F52_010181 [Lecanicillium sp. MT-2017a]|nr:hypothetical protein K4F52_010181 [Lecanicillium sp. MT-2017a]
MTITIDPNTKQPRVTSIYDWETGHITPAILSDPEMAVIVDLTTNADAKPMVTRVKADATTAERTTFASWATHYSKELFSSAPEYEKAIKAGKDARYLWFALRAWRGQDPEGYFGALGYWADERIKVLGKE